MPVLKFACVWISYAQFSHGDRVYHCTSLPFPLQGMCTWESAFIYCFVGSQKWNKSFNKLMIWNLRFCILLSQVQKYAYTHKRASVCLVECPLGKKMHACI